MDFCPNCGSRLFPKSTPSGEQAVLLFACKKCDYKNKKEIADGKLVVKKLDHSPKQMVAIIDKEKQLNVVPTIKIECPRCENKTAYVWQVQTRGADESSTQFMRCTNCEYTFRECT
jgi:transcription factor S